MTDSKIIDIIIDSYQDGASIQQICQGLEIVADMLDRSETSEQVENDINNED